MDTDELLRLADSKDFRKNLKAIVDQTAVLEKTRAGLGQDRAKLRRQSEELDLRQADQDKRQISLNGRDAAAIRRKNQLDQRAETLAKAEGVVQDEKKAAAEQMSAAKAMMSKATKLVESNEAERKRLERRISYLDKIPA